MIPHNNNCQVVIVSTMFLQPLQRNESCYSFTDNGTYIIYVHDTDDNGSAVAVPAIVREYTVDWIIPPPADSTSNKSPYMVVLMSLLLFYSNCVTYFSLSNLYYH